MGETWRFEDDTEPVTADGVLESLRDRTTDGRYESWLVSSRERRLAVVTNTRRAMVMLLDDDSDPGEHAADPGADGWSDGFVLSNGQADSYPDEDTVPLAEAFRIVRHVVATGAPPADAPWRVDR